MTDTRETGPFAQRVAVGVANRKGAAVSHPAYTGIGTIVAIRLHRERADIQFAQAGNGNSVSGVEVTISRTSMGEALMKAQLAVEYDEFDAIKDQGLTRHWRGPRAVRICGMSHTGSEQDTAWPTLRGSTVTGTNFIVVEAGTSADRRLKQAFEAAVLARAPKTDRDAF